MTIENLACYSLEPGGEIHHWLVCGPTTTPVDGLATIINSSGNPFNQGGRWVISNVPDSLGLKKKIFNELSPPQWQPHKKPILSSKGPSGTQTWFYALAEEDHCIDMGLFNFSISWMEGWMYTSLWSPENLQVKSELISVGPIQIWINDKKAGDYADFGYVEPNTIPTQLNLSSGWNDIWLYARMIGWREARMACGLRIQAGERFEIGLPLGNNPTKDWYLDENSLADIQILQTTFNNTSFPIHLKDTASQPLTINAEMNIPFPGDEIPLNLDKEVFSVKSTTQKINLSPNETIEISLDNFLLKKLTYLPNETALKLKISIPSGSPYYIDRKLWGKTNDFSTQPYSNYQSRCVEALEHLSNMPHHILGAIAAVKTGKSETINKSAIDLACHFLEKRFDCADFYAIDLLFLLGYFEKQPALLEQDKDRIMAAFTNFKFWIDEPGLDAMCYHTENHQILFHVAAYLAGQHWPDYFFYNSGLTGKQQKERAYNRIRVWILNRLVSSFSEWDSSSYLALDAYAMLALTELSNSKRLRELSGTLLNKIYFKLACQSFRGVHGSTHGRAYVATLKNAHLENTSGMQRTAWGLGTFNGEARAFGPLALAQHYHVPEIIRKIGADLPETLETHAQSKGRFRPHFDLRGDDWQVNTLTYRTPDYMLSAAQDYLPGEKGWQEHLWQATLSPQAVVFTNQPGNSGEDGNARPNFWAGSYRMPRVGMYKNTLFCIYNLSLSGGMGFTHAYFPTNAFDEFMFLGKWAFGRYKNGYIALACDEEIILIRSGMHAGQELRSSGYSQVWLCHLGRATEYKNFESFYHQVSAQSAKIDGLAVNWTTPQGINLNFDWNGPFSVNGEPYPLNNYPHYENIYTDTPFGARKMIIKKESNSLTLDLQQSKNMEGKNSN